MARKFGVHRRLEREALADAVPRQRPANERPRPKIGPLVEFIDGILEADRRAPRKQRHTAHRIWARITKERPDVSVVESTVRRYVPPSLPRFVPLSKLLAFHSAQFCSISTQRPVLGGSELSSAPSRPLSTSGTNPSVRSQSQNRSMAGRPRGPFPSWMETMACLMARLA